MNTELLANILIPLALGIMMLGVGLSLHLDDFVRVKKDPKPVLIGLAIQLILLPIFAFFLCKFFKLNSNYAIGLMLLSASPGGPSANLFSYLAKGDVALNVSLTAINSLIAVFFIPMIVQIAYWYFANSNTKIPLQFEKVFQLILILLIPISLGIFIRIKKSNFAQKMEPAIKKLSVLFLIVLASAGFYKERANIKIAFADLVPVVLSFNIGSLLLGYATAKLCQLNRARITAITIELGIHNCAIVISIALSPQLLNNMDIAMPAVVYAIFMQISVGLVSYLFYRSANKY